MTPPPRERNVETLAADKAAKTSKIAGPRVVIENLIALPKGTFNILNHALPVGQIDLLAPIFRVCCFLSNFTHRPLRKGRAADISSARSAAAGTVVGPPSAVAVDAAEDCVAVLDEDFLEW